MRRVRPVRRRPVLLALRALGLGDLLTAVPALRALAEAFPGHRRVLAVPDPLGSLAMLTGAVHAVVPARPLAPLPAPLEPDVCVNLHGRGPESHRVLLALRPRRLVAFAHRAVPASAGLPEWRPDEHEVRRWCRLLEESDIPADPGRLDLEVPGPAPVDAAGATIIHPGGKSAARRWPVERWAEVARAERARGREVVVTGSRDEIDLAEAVAGRAGLPASAVLAGRTDLLALARLVRDAGRVVAGDTGIGHLATALRRPSVLLFGRVSPAEWGPPPDWEWHRVIWKKTSDSEMLGITVEEVLEALSDLPEMPVRGGGAGPDAAPALAGSPA